MDSHGDRSGDVSDSGGVGPTTNDKLCRTKTFVRCFPAISGFRVEWRSSKPSGTRVEKMWLRKETNEAGPDGRPMLIDAEEITASHDRKYMVAVGEYMATGGDGYEILTRQKVIVDKEAGKPKVALIQEFLLGLRFTPCGFDIRLTSSLGARFLTEVSRNPEAKPTSLLPETFNFVSKARRFLDLPPLEESIVVMPKERRSKSQLSNTRSVLNTLSGTSSTAPGGAHGSQASSSFQIRLPALAVTQDGSEISQAEPLSRLPTTNDGFLLVSGSWSAPEVWGGSSSNDVADSLADDPQGEGTLDTSQSVAEILRNATVDHIAESAQQNVIQDGRWVASSALQSFAVHIAKNEDMSMVDAYGRQRKGIQIEGEVVTQVSWQIEGGLDGTAEERSTQVVVEKNLPVISPIIDNRLKDLDKVVNKT